MKNLLDHKCRVIFTAHTAPLLKIYTSFSRQAAQAMNIKTSKPRLLDSSSNKTSLWTVNRSPFAHGRHQDQFIIQSLSTDFDLFNASNEHILRFLHYITMNMPAGLQLKYEMYEYGGKEKMLGSSKTAVASDDRSATS